MKIRYLCGIAVFLFSESVMAAEGCPTVIKSYKQIDTNEVFQCVVDEKRLEQSCETSDLSTRIIRKYRSMGDLVDDQRPGVNRAAVIAKISKTERQSFMTVSRFDSKGRVYLTISNGFAHYFTGWNDAGHPTEGKFILMGITPEQATISVPFTIHYEKLVVTTNYAFTADMLKDRFGKAWPVKRTTSIVPDGKGWKDEHIGFDGSKSQTAVSILATSPACH